MRVAIHHHQRKAVALAEALQARGHEIVHGEADAFLIDSDRAYHQPFIDRQVAAGGKAFLYPHGAPADRNHDLEPPYPRVSGAFCQSEGEAEVRRRLGFGGDLYTVGWWYSPVGPFRGAGRVRDVLFGPVHPLQNGLLVPELRQANRDVFTRLLAIDGLRITVRHIHAVEANGLWIEPGVTYVEGAEDNAYAQIDAADVVVSWEGTFPTIAVARGCPTVVFGGDQVFSDLDQGGAPRFSPNHDRYAHYLRYPIDAADGPLDEQLERAVSDEGAIRDWRRRFVGRPWDPDRFVALLEEAVAGGRPGGLEHLELRPLVVAAAAREVIERPALALAYADFVAAHDLDATLLLHAPGADLEVLAEELALALDAAGGTIDALPDTVLEGDLWAAREAAVAGAAHAVLSQAPPAAWAALPRVDDGALAPLMEIARAAGATR